MLQTQSSAYANFKQTYQTARILPSILAVRLPDKTNSQRGANRQIYNLMQTHSHMHTLTHAIQKQNANGPENKTTTTTGGLVSATVCPRQNYKNQHSAERATMISTPKSKLKVPPLPLPPFHTRKLRQRLSLAPLSMLRKT